ncbi:MAG: efflux RND transporter permease subunit, partial [Bacteroidetes bacterium]|nr:efflux RND transporter permease subunit [Bacteroidota bacterium]
TVFADRIISRPYLVIDINRQKIARYGLTINSIQQIIEIAIGGKAQSQSVEGRERYSIRVRYARELRDNPSDIGRILIPTPEGQQIPLSEFAEITYSRGPQMIRSEDNFLVAYVLFDKEQGMAENNVIINAKKSLNKHIQAGKLEIPSGVSYAFAGSYENQIRAEKRLTLIVPVVLLVVFMILYLQFKSVPVSLMIFSGIWIALCGGFVLLWLYGQPWFMNMGIGNIHFQEMFNIESVNLSVAVWVGFIALFGIATDDGVVIATYLRQVFDRKKPDNIEAVRKAVIEAGKRRIRPCLMTTATTLLALFPILSSDGRGADIMIPMAIPLFGGMLIELITLFIVPVLFSTWQERKVSGKDLGSIKNEG